MPSVRCETNANGIPVCPISLKNIGQMREEEVFKVCPDPTIYDVYSLNEWFCTLKDSNAPLTYPHSRKVISEEDLKRLVTKYNKLTNIKYPRTTNVPENTPDTDVRFAFNAFKLLPATSFDDARLKRFTYTEETPNETTRLDKCISNYCNMFIDIFQTHPDQRAAVIKKYNIEVEYLNPMEEDKKLNDEIIYDIQLTKKNLVFENVYVDMTTDQIPYLHIRFVTVVNFRNKKQWLSVNVFNYLIQFKFHLDKKTAIRRNKEYPVDDNGDNITLPFSLLHLKKYKPSPQTSGGRKQKQKTRTIIYNGKSYTVYCGSRNGTYIIVNQKKIYIHE